MRKIKLAVFFALLCILTLLSSAVVLAQCTTSVLNTPYDDPIRFVTGLTALTGVYASDSDILWSGIYLYENAADINSGNEKWNDYCAPIPDQGWMIPVGGGVYYFYANPAGTACNMALGVPQTIADFNCVNRGFAFTNERLITCFSYDPTYNAANHNAYYDAVACQFVGGGFQVLREFGGNLDFITPNRRIPQPTITGYAKNGSDWDFFFTFTEQGPRFSNWGGSPDPIFGYEVYYSFDPSGSTPPASGLRSNWTPTGIVIPTVGDGATVNNNGNPVTISGIWPDPGTDYTGTDMYFGLAVVFADAQAKGPTAFVTQHVSQNSPPMPGPAPLAATLEFFNAKLVKNGVGLVWKTSVENQTVGFNLYRTSKNEPKKVQVNDTMINAQGGGGIGASYKFFDPKVSPGVYTYFLEEVTNQGTESVVATTQISIKGRETQTGR